MSATDILAILLSRSMIKSARSRELRDDAVFNKLNQRLRERKRAASRKA